MVGMERQLRETNTVNWLINLLYIQINPIDILNCLYQQDNLHTRFRPNIENDKELGSLTYTPEGLACTLY